MRRDASARTSSSRFVPLTSAIQWLELFAPYVPALILALLIAWIAT